MDFPSSSHDRRRLMQALACWPITLMLPALSACGGGDADRGATPQATVQDRRVPLRTGVALHVRDWNPGNAERVVVLLAGQGETAQLFNGLAAALADRARVLAVSRRGFGQSDKPLPSRGWRYDTAALVDDLDGLLAALHVGSVVLCGHSIAGNELTLFAGRYPQRVRGLVYMDTTYDYSLAKRDPSRVPRNPALLSPDPQAADGASFAAAVAFAKRIHKTWSPAIEANLRDACEVLPNGSVRPATPSEVSIVTLTEAMRFSPDYSAVRAPALILQADPRGLRDLFPWLTEPVDAQTREDAQMRLRESRQDRERNFEALSAALPDSRRIVIANSNHGEFFIEHQAEVVEAIESMPWY